MQKAAEQANLKEQHPNHFFEASTHSNADPVVFA
jgi:hypothetical protein